MVVPVTMAELADDAKKKKLRVEWMGARNIFGLDHDEKERAIAEYRQACAEYQEAAMRLRMGTVQRIDG